MASSKATTVADYLDELSPDRRASIEAVRSVILKHLPRRYVEVMNWGMIVYELPLSAYPNTYNGQPLAVAGLASQKRHCSVYLSCMYPDTRAKQLKNAADALGLKLDMGKSCIRFGKASDLPLKAIGKIIAGTPPKTLISQYEQAHPH